MCFRFFYAFFALDIWKGKYCSWIFFIFSMIALNINSAGFNENCAKKVKARHSKAEKVVKIKTDSTELKMCIKVQKGVKGGRSRVKGIFSSLLAQEYPIVSTSGKRKKQNRGKSGKCSGQDVCNKAGKKKVTFLYQTSKFRQRPALNPDVSEYPSGFFSGVRFPSPYQAAIMEWNRMLLHSK